MGKLSPIVVLVIVLVGAYFVLGPLVRGFFRRSGGARTGDDRSQRLRDTSLQAAVLASLMLNFPHEILGMSSVSVLLALTLGLALLPAIVAPVLSFFVVIVSIMRLEPSTAMRLVLVLAAFLLLQFLFGRFRPSRKASG